MQEDYKKMKEEIDRLKQDAYTESQRITDGFHDAYWHIDDLVI